MAHVSFLSSSVTAAINAVAFAARLFGGYRSQICLTPEPRITQSFLLIPWDDLPAELGCGCGKTCRHYLRVWLKLHAMLLADWGVAGRGG